MKMEKITVCPKCHTVRPVLALVLENPDLYSREVPDTRTYHIVCVECGCEIQDLIIDNTIKAIAASRAEMDALYGKSFVLPFELL